MLTRALSTCNFAFRCSSSSSSSISRTAARPYRSSFRLDSSRRAIYTGPPITAASCADNDRLTPNTARSYSNTTTDFSRFSSSSIEKMDSFEASSNDSASEAVVDINTTADEPDLPKLSPKEFKIYNRMAEHMDMFHNHFRQTWDLLYKACSTGKRPHGMSLRSFLATAEQFCYQLTIHHTIEEQSIFPVLAKKMPAFRKELELLTQHKQIHEGLDKLEEYFAACRSGEKELRLEEMKTIMDGFGGVLWQHLDDEVKQLGAENMRKYWTTKEMEKMPM